MAPSFPRKVLLDAINSKRNKHYIELEPGRKLNIKADSYTQDKDRTRQLSIPISGDREIERWRDKEIER